MTDIITIPDGDTSFEIRNPVWNNLDHTSFDVELNHHNTGWWPYTVADGDCEGTYCYKLWTIRDTLDIQEAPQKSLDEIAEQRFKDIQNAVQILLDSKAQEKNYDNGFAIASYALSTNETFRTEATNFIAWRDAVWSKCYQLLDLFTSGQIEMPSVENVLEQLPVLEW